MGKMGKMGREKGKGPVNEILVLVSFSLFFFVDELSVCS